MPGPFLLRNYATFTGALQSDITAYSYELSEKEGIWPTDIPVDTTFPNYDTGVVFYRDFTDYTHFHLFGPSPQILVLEKQFYQPLPSLFLQVLNTIINGSIIANGIVVTNGVLICNGLSTINGIFIANGSAIMNGFTTVNGKLLTTGGVTMVAPVIMLSTQFLSGVGDVATAINSKKSFDIPHPTKKDHRLRYVCVETPKADVYVRGKLKDSNVINLPEYWKGLVDPDSIDVVLSPIGSFQELYVEDVQWGTKVIVKNSAGGPINCSYVVYGERKDTEPNIPEYKGLTEADYPGDNSGYNINSD